MSVIIKTPNIDHAKAGLTGCYLCSFGGNPDTAHLGAEPTVYGWAYGLWLGLACDQIQSGLAPGACALY